MCLRRSSIAGAGASPIIERSMVSRLIELLRSACTVVSRPLRTAPRFFYTVHVPKIHDGRR